MTDLDRVESVLSDDTNTLARFNFVKEVAAMDRFSQREQAGAVMDEIWTRFASQMMERLTGPMQFRLVLQPAMALFFAIRSGLADAREGGQPYFWSLVTGSAPRGATLESGLKSVGRVFIFAVVLDVIYQLYVLHFVYPGEALAVAFILAIVPYLIARGLVTRLARHHRVGA